jgi:hypothetical protein
MLLEVSMQPAGEQPGRDRRGEWAEQVAGWYFRLNGFLSIPGFVVHPDEVRRHPRTEADLLGVRFPHSTEAIAGRPMEDEAWVGEGAKICFIIAEVKADVCNVNGPWSLQAEENMERAIQRLGFAPNDQVGGIAQAMYEHLHWEGPGHVLQYVAIGGRVNHNLRGRYPRLKQITWQQISDFLFKRFSDFPAKLRDGGRVHDQWPDFGKKYGRWFYFMGRRERSEDAVRRYLDSGSCMPPPARRGSRA